MLLIHIYARDFLKAAQGRSIYTFRRCKERTSIGLYRQHWLLRLLSLVSYMDKCQGKAFCRYMKGAKHRINLFFLNLIFFPFKTGKKQRTMKCPFLKLSKSPVLWALFRAFHLPSVQELSRQFLLESPITFPDWHIWPRLSRSSCQLCYSARNLWGSVPPLLASSHG